MELGEPDESGRRRPIAIPDSEFVLDVDTVIMAIGTSPNPLISSTTEGLDTNRWGCLIVNEDMATTKDKVYAGGDAVTGAATVILRWVPEKQRLLPLTKFCAERHRRSENSHNERKGFET